MVENKRLDKIPYNLWLYPEESRILEEYIKNPLNHTEEMVRTILTHCAITGDLEKR